MKRQNKKSIIMLAALIMLVSIITCMFTGALAADNSVTVSLRIEGDSECIYYGKERVDSGSSLKTLLEAVNSKQSLAMVGLESDYITEIKGLKSAKYGGWDGWLYLVNGISPVENISDCKLKDGDTVVLFYGDPYGVGFQYPEIEINGEKISVYSMDTEYDASYNPTVKKRPVVGANISIFDDKDNEYNYITDANGEIKADAALFAPGVYSYKIEKYAQNGLPIVLRSSPDAEYTIEKNPETSDITVLFVILAVVSSVGCVVISKKIMRAK